MKITQIGTIFLILIFLASATISARSQSKKLMYRGARQGTEWTVYLLNKKLVQTVELGGETRKIYSIDLEIDNSYSGISQQTNLVQCSTSQPFIAFKDSDREKVAILHFLNPGGEQFGYNSDSHSIYWIICHELWQPWEYDLKSQAVELGYSTRLESQQIEIPYGMLQDLK